ncbi:F-box family protein with DUF295 [Prunus dulcis]|uniref:F-box family protein with DUF295 n=1 Tax=Prunus dulcis TaxID=3755 RepID=A0A5H2XMC1_PRUDU|nr:F-box family protein with DUF295 [Prunus dulcis]
MRIYFKTTSYPFSLVITHSWTDVYGHPVRFQFMSVHLTLPHELRDARTTWCPETCQDCGSADSVSPRPARIADQADYGPLHPARATRADLVSSRNLPADQADHSPLISPVCGSGRLRGARDLPGELTDMTGVQIGVIQAQSSVGHRSTRDPPPGHSKLPRHHVENFGIGQNTGETLPKFRQKSKGNLKRI